MLLRNKTNYQVTLQNNKKSFKLTCHHLYLINKNVPLKMRRRKKFNSLLLKIK